MLDAARAFQFGGKFQSTCFAHAARNRIEVTISERGTGPCTPKTLNVASHGLLPYFTEKCQTVQACQRAYNREV